MVSKRLIPYAMTSASLSLFIDRRNSALNWFTTGRAPLSLLAEVDGHFLREEFFSASLEGDFDGRLHGEFWEGIG